MKTTTRAHVEVACLDGINAQKDRVNVFIALQDDFSHRMELLSALSARLGELRMELANQNVEVAELDGINPQKDRASVFIALRDDFRRRAEQLSALSARLEAVSHESVNQQHVPLVNLDGIKP